MKVLNFETREDWLSARRGKITGSRVGDVITKRGTGKKIGFYELIAERLGIPADDEDAMARGTRLESEAIERFIAETGKKVDTSLKLWVREDNESIAVSPDGSIAKTEAVEVKCLSSARHIEALITQEVPKDYADQVTQYFVVNDKLKKLYLVFYDPRLVAKPFFFLTVTRAEVQEKVTEYLEYEQTILAEVNEIVNKLTF
jgi:putative phage-type endonuclease